MMEKLAKISFVEHKAKMFKEKRKLITLLIASNLVWLAICCFLLMR